MDPYEKKVLRISYYSKLTKKPKHKQVRVDKFESPEAAKKFLEEWKRQQIEAENIRPEEPKAEPKEEPKEEQPVIINTAEQVPPVVQSSLPVIEFTPFEFNPPNFEKSGGGRSTVIIAQSYSGKTTLTKYLCREYLNKPKESILTYMTPSLSADIYNEIKKDKNIITYDWFHPEIIKRSHKINSRTKKKKPYNFVFILDDVIGNDVKNSTELLKMFLTYRNLNISTVLNVQDAKMVARSSRHNGNNFYFLRQGSPDAIEDCLKLFIGAYPPFNGLPMDKKIELYFKATENNGIIYLNALTNKLTFHHAVPEQ